MEQTEDQLAQPAIAAVLMKALVPLLANLEGRDLEGRIDGVQIHA